MEGEICNTVLNLFGMVYSGKDMKSSVQMDVVEKTEIRGLCSHKV